MQTFTVGASTVYSVCHDTCKVLMRVWRIPGIPYTHCELHAVVPGFNVLGGFRNTSQNLLGHCMGHLLKTKSCETIWILQCFIAGRAIIPRHGALVQLTTRSCLYCFQNWQAIGRGFLSPCILDLGEEAYICTLYIINPATASQTNEIENGFNYYLPSVPVHVH